MPEERTQLLYKETNVEANQYSVLMSVYDKEKAEYLEQSIESMLAQTVPFSEFVLVCDGPLTQELELVIEKYAADERFRILRLPENIGLGRALNAGLKECSHEIVARMDSDDISLPERCEKQLLVMEERKLDVVSGSLVEFSDESEAVESSSQTCNSVTKVGKIRRLPQTQEEILAFARRRNPFNHPCVMYRKSSVNQAGGYVHCAGFEDYHLWVRMLMKGMQGYNLQEVILKMRTSGMYGRRGGMAYAGQIFRFRKYLLRIGFCSFGDFLYAAAGHMAVSLLPSGMRRLFYNKILRK